MSVFDSSIVIKLFSNKEHGSDEAKALLRRHIEEGIEIIVPELGYLETANVFAKKVSQGELSKETLVSILEHLKRLPFTWCVNDRNDVDSAATMALDTPARLYDKLFLVTARKYKTQLYTADSKFVGQVRASDVIPL